MIGLTNDIRAFLPLACLRCLPSMADGTVPAENRGESAVLFFDVSGFTALSETLSQKGQEGAELLAACLNLCFGRLLDVIEKHGGEVIKFAGDAAYVLFESRGPIDRAGRALACAWEINQTLTESEPPLGFKLRIRVGVAEGMLWFGRVGGVGGRWEFVAGGDAIDEAGRCAAAAEPGEIVVTNEIFELVQPNCGGALRTDGRVHLTECPRLDAARPTAREPSTQWNPSELEPFLQEAFLDRIRSGQGEHLAEFRRATILFLSVQGLSYGKPDILSQLQAICSGVQSVIQPLGGSLHQFLADDKGTTGIGVWGGPGHSHEDDAYRAALGALRIREIGARLGHAFGIGVATGRIFFGVRGGRFRKEYAMAGKTVNLAARLMQAGDLLYDRETAVKARDRLEFVPLQRRTFKGFAAPIEVFHCLGETVVQNRFRAGLVGREDEREILTQAAASLGQTKQLGIVLIEGEAGLGKSTLAAFLADQCRSRNLPVTQVESDELRVGEPFLAWRSIFREWLAEESVAKAVLEKALAAHPTLRPFASVLKSVMPIDLEEHPETEFLPADSRGEILYQLLTAILHEWLSIEPRTLIFDDAQWMDSLSWELLMRIVRAGEPFLLTLTTRPLNHAAERAELAQLPRAIFCKLDGMAKVEITALVKHTLRAHHVPEPLFNFVWQRAGGNPFFCEQLVLSLLEAGHIHVNDGVCRVAAPAMDLTALNLRPDLEGAIVSRLDKLSPAQQLAVKVASVIGRTFHAGMFAQIFPLAHKEVAGRAILDNLFERGSFDRGDEIAGLITFRNALVRDAAYELVSYEQRRILHRATAQWIQANPSEGQTSNTILAHHWKNAGEPALALPHLDRAADEAMGLNANAEALHHLTEALELDRLNGSATPLQTRARWHRQSAQASMALGHLQITETHIYEGAKLLGTPIPRGVASLTLATLAEAALQIGSSCYPKRPAAANQRGMESERAWLLRLLAEWGYFNLRFPEMVYAAIRSLRAAEKLGPSPELATALASVAIVASATPGFRWVSRRLKSRTESMLRALDNPMVTAWCEKLLAIRAGSTGEWNYIEQKLTDALEVFARFRNNRYQEESLVILAVIYLYRGEVAKSAAAYAQMSSLGRLRNDDQVISWGVLGEARLLLEHGNPAGARHILEENAVLLNADALSRLDHYGIACLAEARCGNRSGALMHGKAFLAIAGPTPPTGFAVLYSYSHAAEGLLHALEFSLAEHGADAAELGHYARYAIRTMLKFSITFPIGKPRSRLLLGRYCEIRGCGWAARILWKRGLHHLKSLELPSDEVLLCLALARHDTRDQKTYLDRVRRVAERYNLPGRLRSPALPHSNEVETVEN